MLSDMTWEMGQPVVLPWGTVQARGSAMIQVRSPERFDTLGTVEPQVAAVQEIIVQSLMDILSAQHPMADQLSSQLWEITSATLVAANSRLYAYGATLLDLSIDEITIQP